MLNEIDDAKVMAHFAVLKSRPRPRRTTAQVIIERYSTHVASMLAQGWTILEIMTELSEASDAHYSPYTLRNAWFRHCQKVREQQAMNGVAK